MKTLRPKSYIKSNEKSEEYQCSICNYVAEKPQRCNGPCKKIFCMQCVKCIKSIRNECPYKCSTPFELTSEKEVDLEYRCPFQPGQCKEVIKSLSDFFAHGERCQYLPEGWKEKEENYSRYRCEKGHDLFYLGQEGLRILYQGSFYEKVMNSYCCCCKEQGYCRSICPQCSTKSSLVLFCTSCRKPPCTKNTCLYEHQLRKIPHYGSKSRMCDFCGTAVYLYGPDAYEDRECNFDVCESCFANLPEKHDQVPFKMSAQTIEHLKFQSQEQSNQDLGIGFMMESDQDSHENPVIIGFEREEQIGPIEIDERQIVISVGTQMQPKEEIEKQIVISMPTQKHSEEEQPDYHSNQKQKKDQSCLTRICRYLFCCFKPTTGT